MFETELNQELARILAASISTGDGDMPPNVMSACKIYNSLLLKLDKFYVSIELASLLLHMHDASWLLHASLDCHVHDSLRLQREALHIWVDNFRLRDAIM